MINRDRFRFLVQEIRGALGLNVTSAADHEDKFSRVLTPRSRRHKSQHSIVSYGRIDSDFGERKMRSHKLAAKAFLSAACLQTEVGSTAELISHSSTGSSLSTLTKLFYP